MFGVKLKNKEPELNNPVTNKSVSAKDIKSLIGEGCRVEGSFFIPTATRIDGYIKGDLTGDGGVIIGTSGKISGSISVSEVVIMGTVDGNIETQRLELKKGAWLSGDIIVGSLITESGSTFNGKCSMKTENSNVTELIPEEDNSTGNVKIKTVMTK
ncbi:MAG: polymer-forming cytoskeletal protein [Ignavibacteria bacterium]|nr:polymer-forming cytoskeletal protein [Ignavibacteria bacterium]